MIRIAANFAKCYSYDSIFRKDSLWISGHILRGDITQENMDQKAVYQVTAIKTGRVAVYCFSYIGRNDCLVFFLVRRDCMQPHKIVTREFKLSVRIIVDCVMSLVMNTTLAKLEV